MVIMMNGLHTCLGVVLAGVSPQVSMHTHVSVMLTELCIPLVVVRVHVLIWDHSLQVRNKRSGCCDHQESHLSTLCDVHILG